MCCVRHAHKCNLIHKENNVREIGESGFLEAETLAKTRKDDLVTKGEERGDEARKGCIALLRLKEI